MECLIKQCIVALPWFVDRPYRNITTPLASHRFLPLLSLSRPVVSVDHICRPVHHHCTVTVQVLLQTGVNGMSVEIKL